MAELPFINYVSSKALGLSFVGNDLVISQVKKGHRTASYKSLILENFLTRHPEEFRQAVRPAVHFSRTIVLSWPRSKTIVRDVELPNIKLKEFKETLAFQLDTFLPFKSEDVYYDIFPSRHDSKTTKIFVVGAKKEELDDVLGKLEALGLRPSSVIFTPLALLSFVETGQGSEAYVNKENGYYHYSLFVDGFLDKTVLLPKDGDVVSLLEADRPSQVRCVGADTIAGDIRRQSPGKITSLEEGTESVGAGAFTPDAALYNFSLIGTRKKVLDGQTILCIVLSLLLISLSFLVPYLIKNRKVRILGNIEQEIVQLKKDVRRVKTLQKQLIAQETTLDKIRSFKANYVFGSTGRATIDVLLELTKILPKDAWITRYRFAHNNLTIEGVAPSATNLIPLLEASPLFKNVALSSSVVKSREGKELFQIALDINKPAHTG